MKASLVVLALALATAPLGAAAAPSCARLVVTGHPTYAPFSWSSHGSLRGAGIDVVKRLAADARIPLAIVVEGTWNAAQDAVKSGKADAIVGLYRTPARLPFFDYVEPAVAQDPSAIVTRAGSPFVYKGWNDLIGKKGAVARGESYGAAFDAFAKAHLTLAEENGFGGVYRALLDGRAQYGLVGYFAAETEPQAGIRIVDAHFVTEGLYLAFGKHDPCASVLSAAFARDIARLQKNGTVNALIASNLADYRAGRR